MKFANTLSVRVFCKSFEDRVLIFEAFKRLLGFDDVFLNREKLSIGCVEASGFVDKILIFEIFLVKDRHINKVLDNLRGNLSFEDKSRLISQLDRFDGEFNFFLRLSKSSLINGLFVLTDSGDCFHIKMNVACFPKNLDSAVGVVRSIFS